MPRCLHLICGCETGYEDGSYRVLRVRRGSKCHVVGETISAERATYIRYINREWDRAESEYLDQA